MDENYKRLKEEVESIDLGSKWNHQFQGIRQESSSYEFPCGEARSPANKPLNRYRDVSPFDHSRVVLHSGPCNYINASLVKVGKAGRNYILTQGPLPQTAGHFWLMVWEQKSKAILMLNKIIEKSQIKCHQYWPVGSKYGDSDSMIFQDDGLKVTLLAENESKHFIIRTLSIEEIATKSSREVMQFHYVTWPDFGVPSTPRAFLHFLQEVRDSGALDSNVGPPVVHCSAGIGRSGTFCLVDSCLLMMENGISVNIKDVLLEMRKFRMGLIQTSDQLRFSYLAILEGVQQLADGKTRFMPDTEENGDVRNGDDEQKPKPPPRLGSLNNPTNDEFIRYIRMHVGSDVPEIKTIPDGPLPELPSSSDEDSSDEDIHEIDEVDSDSETGELEEEKSSSSALPPEDSVEDIPIEEDEDHINTNNLQPNEDTNNGHAKSNSIDETALRRRIKNEATMGKIREIKQKQKESEMKTELYQRVYRSPVPKRRKESQSSTSSNSQMQQEKN